VTDEHGRRRLDDPDDFVRLEIEAALSRNVRVIPILVGGARMPRAEELPDSLAKLVRRQALELHPARFDFDTGRLLKVLDGALAEARAAQGEPSPAQSAVEAAPATPPAPPPPSRPGAPPGERPRRRSTRARVLAAAAVAVVLITVVAVIVANSGTTQSPTGAPSAGPSAGAATTSTSTSARSTTTAPPAGEVVFRDNFSNRNWGWEGDQGAGYVGGAYRISAPAAAEGSGAGSVPTKADSLNPTAPPRIRITVHGRRLPGSDRSMQYGIFCRSNGATSYLFSIADNYVAIERWGSGYRPLKEAHQQVKASSTNKLQAVCMGGSGRQPVHLELWVNGQKVAEATDRNAPLPPGVVGLAVATEKTTRASLAEFDDFVVEQVA
jgi:hypothetical protein